MELSLKLSALEEEKYPILSELRNNVSHYAKLSTTKKEIIPDRKDPRFINTLKNVKIVFKKEDGGVLILIGHLQVDFRPPFGGAFFCRRVVEETTEYVDNAKKVYSNNLHEYANHVNDQASADLSYDVYIKFNSDISYVMVQAMQDIDSASSLQELDLILTDAKVNMSNILQSYLDAQK